jgi:hypothetical protein
VSTRLTNHREPYLDSNDEASRPPLVEVLLDDNTAPRRRTERGAHAPRPARSGTTIRRTIVILALGAFGGAGLSQGLAHSRQPTAPTSATARPVIPPTPVDDVQAALTELALPTGGTVSDLLVAGLDAVTQAQLAHAASTDGPQQAAAIRFLRQRHDDIRSIIVSTIHGTLPYPMP